MSWHRYNFIPNLVAENIKSFPGQDRGILDQQVNVQNCAKFVSGWTVQFLFHSFTIFHQIYLGLHQDIRNSVETNIRIIRIFEYFFPNNTIRIRIRPILKSRIIFEYSNKCSEYSEYFFRVFTGKNQNEKYKNGRLQQPK